MGDVIQGQPVIAGEAEGEALVRAAAPDAIIMRPSIVFGPEDEFFNRFAAMAQISPIIPLIGGGDTKFQPVYVGDVAKACFDRGIISVGSTGNRLAIPDFDINDPERGICHLQDEPTLICFSGPWLKPLALRDVYEMRSKCNPEDMVMGSGGVEKWNDAVQMMMCGADFVQICTATMIKGFGILPSIVKNVKQFMKEKGVWLSPQPFLMNDNSFADPVSQARWKLVVKAIERL